MLRRLGHGFGELTLTAGAVLALYLGWLLIWTDARVDNQVSDLTAHARSAFDVAERGIVTTEDDASPDGDSAASGPARGVLALVHLPAIGETVPVLPGVTMDVLDRGVLGQYPGTAPPGATGNFAVAGHRNTYGSPLMRADELRPGDPIIVETPHTWFVYAVRDHWVVSPDRYDIVAPVPGEPRAEATEAVTVLTTCHPRFGATSRLITVGDLVREQPRSAGRPAELPERD